MSLSYLHEFGPHWRPLLDVARERPRFGTGRLDRDLVCTRCARRPFCLRTCSRLDAPWALALAVALMGLSQGAEGDVAGFLVMRHFGIGVYSSVLGIVIASLGVTSAAGRRF
ncbi:MAG: hypothetical protein ACREXY_04505 [Gammaproteobacteria bacterium]